MNPVNVICEHCGADNLVEPEVEYDEDAICPTCKRNLYRDHEAEAEAYYAKHPEILKRLRIYFDEYNKKRPPGIDPVII